MSLDFPPHEDEQEITPHSADRFGDIDQRILDAASTLLGDTDRERRIAQDVERIVSYLRETNNVAGAKAMYRYLQEGVKQSYSASSPLPTLLADLPHETQNPSLLDLGAGPGELVTAWKSMGNTARGIDLSPSFVHRHPNLRLGLIDAHDATLSGIQARRSFDVVTSALTLDRVAFPKQLIMNMAASTRHGIGVLVTLLPVIPVDDEQVGSPITYTLPENRITNTGTEEGDKANIHEFMENTFGRSVQVEQIQYEVRTATGEKIYPNTFAFITGAAQQPSVLSRPVAAPGTRYELHAHQSF